MVDMIHFVVYLYFKEINFSFSFSSMTLTNIILTVAFLVLSEDHGQILLDLFLLLLQLIAVTPPQVFPFNKILNFKYNYRNKLTVSFGVAESRLENGHQPDIFLISKRLIILLLFELSLLPSFLS